MERRIIDKRKKEKFMVDDEYLNGQAKLCGWQGTIVYNSLCRHANINQESFPSIKLMAEQHGVSRPTIMKGIENLEKRRVIEVKKTRTKDGKWLNNTYILLDKSGWDYCQVNVVDMDTQVNQNTLPSQRGLPDGVNVVDTKETHSEGNTYKETHLASKLAIDRVMELFKEYSPSLDYGNTTQRKAVEEMLAKWPLEKLEPMVIKVIQSQKEEFAPRASTPKAMWQKIGDFRGYFAKVKKTDKFTNILSV